MVDVEEYFPRGGKKPSVTYFKQSGNFLAAAEKGERKKIKPKKKSEEDNGYLSDEVLVEDDQSFKNCGVYLSYKIIKEGQVLLGRIQKIQDTKIQVSLPCRLTGIVMACHVSEAYNKQLDAYVNDQVDEVCELPKMFRLGQYVAVRVLENNNNKLMLSMMPHHVNVGRLHSELHKGALLQAAVSSVEDHGYVMEVGINNTRTFLPKAAANPEIALEVGVVTWCCVTKTVMEGSNAVLTLSNELESLQKAIQRRPTSTLLPGTALEFIVNKSLDNGIEGCVFDGTTAYIQRQQADKVKGKRPNLGQKIRARVLYVIPTRNTPFLTMKDIFSTTYPDLQSEQRFQEGEIIEDAQVIKILGRSIVFKIGRDSIGTMSLRKIQVDEDLTDEDVIAKSYPIGSTHTVRVMCYNMSDYSYYLSDEPSILSEKIFTISDLAIGDIVPATVKLVTEGKLVLAVGRLVGLVPQTHVSDSGIYVDPKKASTSQLTNKFQVGQHVKARVLTLSTDKMFLLTLKPSLLFPDLEILQNYEEAVVGKVYTGVIQCIRDYLLVSFFNNVMCYVRRAHAAQPPPPNLATHFHLGQIVNCTILGVDVENKKMFGTLLAAIPEQLKQNRKTTKRQMAEDSPVPQKKERDTKFETEPLIPNKKERKTDNKVEATEYVEIEGDNKRNRDIKAGSHIDKQSPERKRKKKDMQNMSEESGIEESDEKETINYEDSNNVLNPNDKGLVDLSDCTTFKLCTKRMNSIKTSIQAKYTRLSTIARKIISIEKKGLTVKNKKFHTAMHMEKQTTQLAIIKLYEALAVLQNKVKELGGINNEIMKIEKKEKVVEITKKSNIKEDKPKAKKTIDNSKVDKATKLETVIEVPSAKEFWSVSASAQADVQQQESSNSEEEEEEKSKKKRKKLTAAEKVARAREEEEKIRRIERQAEEAADAPRSADHFERALLASPNSSQLWIAYMAFHLQATEIERARAVGQRALKTICFREEQEKFNVTVAMLNLEHRFGTKESQHSTLQEALQMHDKCQVHLKLLDIYVETGKTHELYPLVDLMMRLYRLQPEMYVECGRACFSAGMSSKAREVMQKGIRALDKKHHVSLLVQFAKMERAHGFMERFEALIEQVLSVYPQRVDVCSVYVDALVKNGDVERIRQLMETMSSQNLPARKMKVLYKKWIEVEERIGDQEHVEKIRERAKKYIEKAKF